MLKSLDLWLRSAWWAAAERVPRLHFRTPQPADNFVLSGIPPFGRWEMKSVSREGLEVGISGSNNHRLCCLEALVALGS